MTELLAKRRRELRTFIGLIAKVAAKNMYAGIVRHSISLQWVYDRIREQYDIQNRGIHFLNIIDLKYDPETKTPAGFYNEYRTVILNNVGRAGEVIQWNNNNALDADEVVGPLFEDVILMNVLTLIDPRLPRFVKKHYQLKMDDRRLTDIKNDIFINLKQFLTEMEAEEQLASLRLNAVSTSSETPSLAAFNNRGARGRSRGRARGSSRPQNQRRTFCKTCYEGEKGRSTYLSHSNEDYNCPSRVKLNTLTDDIPPEVLDYEQETGESESEVVQVPVTKLSIINTNNTGLNALQPVPTQLLTLTDAVGEPIHIELDSAATVNYISHDEAVARNFYIVPNSQMSKLGDGTTILKAIGQISTILYRDDLPLRYDALVCKTLHCPVIGGTPFLKQNGIKQDFVQNVISLSQDRKIVPATTLEATLPIKPCHSPQQPTTQPNNKLMSVKTNKIVLPGDTLELDTDLQDQTVLVEGWLPYQWPEPQLVSISQGKIAVVNQTQKPILFDTKRSKSIKITTTTDTDWTQPCLSTMKQENQKPIPLSDTETIDLIKIENTSTDIKDLLQAAHRKFRKVFSKDLSGGYNGFFGHHECKLNWATAQRPEARKIPIANYNHSLKGIMQEICDDLTEQGVLKIPQDHNVMVQSVCPSFLRRKRRAQNKPLHQLTKHDCRLVVNFNPINDHIKNIPSPMTTVNDVHSQLGRWKEIIIIDLYNAFFQNHVRESDQQWLGIMTPFSGLRVLTRSGQGLLGQSEELDELMAKILGDEIKEGRATKIQDDIIIGGQDQLEAARNYIRILEKFDLSNLRAEPEKTIIFPEKADISGWIWEKGGFISVSPHRRNSLINTKEEDIRTVKDMRSFIGLYKTLHIATPNMTRFITPLEDTVQGLHSKDKYEWSHAASQRFREAKSHVTTKHTLYLPHPSDQLVIKPDGASNKPGIGHTLFAVKEKSLIPVRYHSAKLSDQCKKWSPCEVEAMSVAVAIESEYPLLRESLHPIMILPDSKPVQQAIELIKKGKFSTSSRMNRFLSNVNKIPIVVKHLSGKYDLNTLSDHQSRHPSECTAEVCSIHKFISEISTTVLDPASKCAPIKPIIEPEPDFILGANQVNSTFFNRAAWIQAQENNDSCKAAKYHLMSGKTPTTMSGNLNNEIRFLIRTTKLAPDGLLVTRGDSSVFVPGEPKEKIIVPHNVAPGTLYHLHNSTHFGNHPSKSQLKTVFNRRFYTWNLQPLLDKLYKNCYTCSIIQKQPKISVENETKSDARHPHRFFHADVIKREGQFILLITDHFTSLTSSKLIKSEKAEDLRSGLISLTTPVRHPGPILVTTDAAPGFISLAKGDKQLNDLLINIKLKDQLNKNYNAVVDRACQDIERELRKLAPEGGKINESILAKATIAVNTILRRKGTISAYELHTARSQDTGENLLLKDDDISNKQINLRQSKEKMSYVPDIKVGDTVTSVAPQDKHKAREIYLVTGECGDKVSTQRLLHPLSETPLKFMSRRYEVNPKHLVRINRPPHLIEESSKVATKYLEERRVSPRSISRRASWNPVNPKYYEESSSDDDDDDFPGVQEDRRIFVMPITPSVSNQSAPQVQITPPSEASISDNEDQEHEEDLPSEHSDSSSVFESVHEHEDFNQEEYINDQEDNLQVDMTVPDQDTSGSAPNVTLTDDEMNYLDDFFDEIGVAGGSVETHETVEVPSDQDPEDYVQQFSPDYVPDQVQHEEEEDDESQLIDYLRTFNYIQGQQPKKNDILYYYDTNEGDFIKVKILSRSNYRYYYNIKYLEINRPNGGVKLEPNGFWSRALPVQNVDVQEHPVEAVQEQHEVVLPPVEEERRERHTYVQRQVSPVLYQQGVSSLRPNRVCRLPEDHFRDQLSPRSRRRADGLSLAPQQEFMRSALARSLAPSRPSAPASRVFKAVRKVLGKKQ